MATLCLHVGMPKTGTTFLQQLLVKNRPRLEREGMCYPCFSDIFPHLPTNRNAFFLSRKKESQADVARALERVNQLAQTHSQVILSNEHIWRYRAWDPAFWEMLARNISPDVDIRVIVYLRRQDQYMYSQYAQVVKTMIETPQFRTLTFADYYREFALLEEPDEDYAATLDVMAAAIGADHITVRVYDRELLEADGGITADFLDVLGLREVDDWEMPSRKLNPSLRDSVLETKRLLNRNPDFNAPGPKVEDPYTKILTRVQADMAAEGLIGSRTGFPTELRSEIIEHFSEGNARIAREYLGREDGVLFDTDLSDIDDDEAMRPFAAEELVDVCGRVIAYKEKERKSLETRNAKLAERVTRLEERNRGLKELREHKNAQVERLQKKAAVLEEKNRELERSLERTFARRVKRLAGKLLKRLRRR